MVQKIIKIGSSAAVVLPKDSLVELGLKLGDEVRVEVNTHTRSYTIEPIVASLEKKITTEAREWASSFIKEYGPALKALADK